MRTSKDHIKNLQEYIDDDQMYQEFCKGKEPSHNDGNTDFEWFCIDHCADIAWVLNELKECRKSENEIWRENQNLHLSHMTFINDLDTIIMLLKYPQSVKSIKHIVKLLEATRDNLEKIYNE